MPLWKMSDLKQGEQAIVVSFSKETMVMSRLRDMGLMEGTVVSCVGESPLGDPKAYQIRGAVVAVRYSEASHIFVKGRQRGWEGLYGNE